MSYLKEDFKTYQILEEIHYKMNGRNYFGLGFKNDSGGYEVRNLYIKICLGKKDITTIEKNSETLKIFEGFSDYLSYLILKNKDQNFSSETFDYVILNSTSMMFKIEKLMGNYLRIVLYLDNDNAGDLLAEKLNTLHSHVHDQRKYYKDFKDLNEFLISKKEE